MSGEFIDSKVMSVGVLTFTLFVAISTVGYISGGCFNPAVCLTVDIVKFIYFGEEDYVKDIWIFILAPMIGSVFGALISLIYLGDKKFKAVDASD